MEYNEKLDILNRAKDAHILTIKNLKAQPVSESQRDILKDFEKNLLIIEEKISKLKFEIEQESKSVTLKTGKQK